MNYSGVLRAMVVCSVAILALGCSSAKMAQPSTSAAGEQSKPRAFLAYEHKISIRYASDLISAREDALRKACVDEQFGQCSLLAMKQTSGNHPSGEMALRVAPAAVEPLVKLAAEGGTLWLRETRAEDLAEAVADTEQSRAVLTKARENYQRLQERKDAPVADQLAVARELAALEAAFDANTKTAAQQRRRIETNLLTFDLRVNDEQSRGSRIGAAFLNLGDSFSDGLAEALGWIGYGLPMLVLAFVVALLWRWCWRKATRRRAA